MAWGRHWHGYQLHWGRYIRQQSGLIYPHDRNGAESISPEPVACSIASLSRADWADGILWIQAECERRAPLRWIKSNTPERKRAISIYGLADHMDPGGLSVGRD